MQVEIVARDFVALPGVEAIVAGRREFAVEGTVWRVDEDNPAWPEVRADAIRAAVAKAHDYATALGGNVVTVEHIADAGLLDGGRSAMERGVAMSASARSWSANDEPSSPCLDPVPCELEATIDARFTAEGVTLG